MKSSERADEVLQDEEKPSFGIRKGKFHNKKKGVAFVLALLFGAVGMQDLYLDRVSRWTLKLPMPIGVIVLLNLVNVRTLFVQWSVLNIATIALAGLLCLVWLYDVVTILFKPAADFSGENAGEAEDEEAYAPVRERRRGKNKVREEQESIGEPAPAEPVPTDVPAMEPEQAFTNESLFAAEMRAAAREEELATKAPVAEEQSFDLFEEAEFPQLSEPEWVSATPAAEPEHVQPPMPVVEREKEPPEQMPMPVEPPMMQDQMQTMPERHTQLAPAEMQAMNAVPPPMQPPPLHQVDTMPMQHTRPMPTEAQAVGTVPMQPSVEPTQPLYPIAPIPMQSPAPITAEGQAMNTTPAQPPVKPTQPLHQGAPAPVTQAQPVPAVTQAVVPIPAQQPVEPPQPPRQTAPAPVPRVQPVPVEPQAVVPTPAQQPAQPIPPPVQEVAQPDVKPPVGLPQEEPGSISSAAKPTQPLPEQEPTPKAKPLNEEVMQGVYDAIAEYDVTQLQIKYSLPVKEARAVLFLAHCTREFGKDDVIVRKMVSYYKLVPQETARVIKTFNTHMS